LLWLFWRQAHMDYNLPVLCFPLILCFLSSYCSWDDRFPLLHPAVFCWDEVWQTFLPGLPSNHNPPDFSLPSS
jgi:hypothetical protein